VVWTRTWNLGHNINVDCKILIANGIDPIALNGFYIIFSLFLFGFFQRRSAILNEVQTQGSTKLPSNKSVLVLGDNATGKTTLIAKLQGVEDPKKGSGLEYAYIDVKDEYRDGKCYQTMYNWSEFNIDFF